MDVSIQEVQKGNVQKGDVGEGCIEGEDIGGDCKEVDASVQGLSL